MQAKILQGQWPTLISVEKESERLTNAQASEANNSSAAVRFSCFLSLSVPLSLSLYVSLSLAHTPVHVCTHIHPVSLSQLASYPLVGWPWWPSSASAHSASGTRCSLATSRPDTTVSPPFQLSESQGRTLTGPRGHKLTTGPITKAGHMGTLHGCLPSVTCREGP